MTTLWRQPVNGNDSGQIDNGVIGDYCGVLTDIGQLVPDRNAATCHVVSAADSFDRAVFSILTSGYLPQAGSGSARFYINLPSPFSLLNNSSIFIFNNNAGSPIPVVDVYIDSAGHVNWYSGAGTISAAARDDHSTFVVVADTLYCIQFDWLGDAGGGGFKKLWINTNPTLVGGANTPDINITALTGTPANCVIGEARGGIDHIDGSQTSGYTLYISRGQISDGSAIVDIVAPTNSSAATVSGLASVGSPETATPGVWTGFPDVTGQWFSDDGTGPVAINGATTLTYTPTTSDLAKVLTYVETAINLFGTVTHSSAATAAVTSGVAGLPATIDIYPAITGNPQAGLLLGTSSGTWSSSLPITGYQYQWVASPFGVLDVGVGNVPVALGRTSVGGLSGLDDVPDLEVNGPYTVPHNMALEEGFMRYAGDIAVSHTRMVVYGDNGAGTFPGAEIDTSLTNTVPANDPVADRPFEFVGGQSLVAGQKVWLGWWTDGNIDLPYSALPGGLLNFYKVGLPFSEGSGPASPYPADGSSGPNAYTLYLRDSAFVAEAGETLPGHVVSNAEFGDTLIARVTAINNAGPSLPAYSNPIGPIGLASYPVSTTAPHIDAIPVQGVPLTGLPGTFYPTATSLTFQWLASRTEYGPFQDISGSVDTAFSSTFTPATVGLFLRFAVIATGPGGTSPPYYSNVVGPVLDTVEPPNDGRGPLPWLEFCGVEVGNSARTLAYLRNGLADKMTGHWELGNADECGVLYRLNGAACGSTNNFVSPVADPAPWYDARDRGSAQFLGLVMLDIQGYDSTIKRAVTNRISGLGGGFFGQQNREPRLWKFRGVLISSGGAGAEYGLRWLTHVLQASCDPCTTCDLKVRLFCPPEDCSDDQAGQRISYDVALVDGPHEVEPWGPRRSSYTTDTLAGARDYVTVEFTVAAANPFLYDPLYTRLEIDIGQQSNCVDICDFLFGSPGDAHCAIVDPPLSGTLGSVFTLSTGALAMGGMFLETYKTCPGVSSSPPVPHAQIHLSGVPANSSVVVNSATHEILVYTLDPATGVTTISNGEHLVVLPTGQDLQWLEIAYCDDIHCFCVRVDAPCVQGQVSVVLETQKREG